MRFPVLLAIAPLALLAACKKEAPAPQPTVGPSAAASPAATPPPAPAGQARKVSESSDRYEFEYNYPAAADAIPALKARLEADLVKQRAKLATEAQEAMADAKQNGYPYHPHSFSIDWKVVTDLPNWLSLSTVVATYEGGAHPNYHHDALLWDKAKGAQVAALDLFTSKSALSQALRKDFCAALDREREKKRQEPLKPGDMFTDCLDPLDYTVILGSAGHQRFDRIGVLVPPYEAGPYVEGAYEVTLPVTAKILALVKPEYRASFVAGR